MYYIHAQKIVDLELSQLQNILQGFSSYPQFMLGYIDIKVENISKLELLTAIHFDPPMSPFTSKFTNEVQLLVGTDRYQQCWRQLEKYDTRVKEAFSNAPKANQGYWLIERIDNHKSKLSYYATIKPPISLPKWLYLFFAEHTYVEVFQRILHRADNKIYNISDDVNDF